MSHRPHRLAWLTAALLLPAGTAFAADPIEGPSMPDNVHAHPAAEQKLDTPLRLRWQARALDGTPVAAGVPDPVTVEITGTISPELADAIAAAHGTVIDQSPRWGSMRATLPLAALLTIAERTDVRRIRLPARARTN